MRLRYPLVAVVVVLVAFLGYAAWRVHARQRPVTRLDEMTAELDRADPGWRLQEIEAARALVPEAENSARVVVAVRRLLPRAWPDPQVDDALSGVAPPELLAPATAERVKAELGKAAAALPEARRLANLPRGRHNIQFRRNVAETLLTDQQEARTVSNLLRYDAVARAQAGDIDGALTSCRAALNAGRSLGDEPLVISQLIRNAVVSVALRMTERTLAQGEAGPDELAAAQRAFAEEDRHPGLLVSLRGERAAQHEFFDAVEKGEIRLDARAKDDPTVAPKDELVDGLLTRQRFRREHAAMLAVLTRRIEAARRPLHEQAAAERALDAEVDALPRDMLLTKLLMPSLDKMGAAERRKHAWVRCTVVALAVERHRRQHGAWPASLEQLRPGLLKEVPLDPFDGRPLRYRGTPDGVVVYSVGPDGRDNGGRLDRDNPTRLGADLGVQLWDVKQRRRPPRPAAPEGRVAP